VLLRQANFQRRASGAEKDINLQHRPGRDDHIGQAAGDAKRGEQIFNQCRPCHSLEAGKNGIGPSLHGLLGRKAGTVPGYNYSPAMQRSGVVWNEDTLAKFLADPNGFIPGTKMVIAGIGDEALAARP